MKSLWSRILVSATLAAIAFALLAGLPRSSGAAKEPNKLVILSTSDVKGKTSPCG